MASEDDGGLSTPQKIVAGTALGVPTPAAVGVARKLMSDGNDNDDGLSTGGGRSTSRRKSSPARSKASTARGKVLVGQEEGDRGGAQEGDHSGPQAGDRYAEDRVEGEVRTKKSSSRKR
jgi:hypothetical protein